MAQGSTEYRAREHRANVGSDFKEKAAEKIEEVADAASDQLGKAADTVEGVATKVAAQGREAGQQVQQVAGNLKGAVDRSVKEQPMATLALAAVLGFVLGALWKR